LINTKVDAILWDYDGTLVNSAKKNIEITKQILFEVAPRLSGNDLPVYLKDEEKYHFANHQAKNWQDLYLNYYGLNKSEMLEAGAMWSDYQLKNATPVELFSEIKQTVTQIELPQGICSQNSSQNINRVLKNNRLTHKFNSIIGYDDIPNNVQKPLAFGGLVCIEQLLESNYDRTIFYIGDHEGDVEFARNIELKLPNGSKVVSITVKYSGANTNHWTFKPDFEIDKPSELIEVLNEFN